MQRINHVSIKIVFVRIKERHHIHFIFIKLSNLELIE